MTESPLLTRMHNDWGSFALQVPSCYIHGRSSEERSSHPTAWEENYAGCQFVEVIDQGRFQFSVEKEGTSEDIRIRSQTELTYLIESLPSERIYIDITGLETHIWAPLIRAAIGGDRRVMAVYVEPKLYRHSLNPTEGRLFDITDKFTEISSFPGFARLESVEDESKICFVPLLGFEGNRLAHAIERVDPPAGKIFPVIGVPGFRADFPFNTYIGNRVALAKDGLWKEVRFAIANSPISALDRLRTIAGEYPDHLIKVAPLGTRPHALGAVLFALTNDGQVELVYDNPTPATQRSAGTGNILIYDVTSMVALPSGTDP